MAITSFAGVFGSGAVVSNLVHADSVLSDNKEVGSSNLLVGQSKAKIRAYSAESRQANQSTILLTAR
ncbi:hypothetical protein [Weissella oryzae]|uniref:hypothetical protein n=1 Tax=Weissella oryzae TaxID=1129792 RepID=UPI0004854AE6|nr:hypothetical protein [Weissella oryzae]